MTCSSLPTFAEPAGAEKTLLYIPIDNRPINLRQTVEVAEKLGYEILTPPEEFLGRGSAIYGEPEKLWSWLEENAPKANFATISTDALLYGSLVSSRVHDFDEKIILQRSEKFADLRKKFPQLPIYAFSTIMRTPHVSGSSAEPAYYAQYGEKIFDLTALTDKFETEKLSRKEDKKLAALKSEIPEEVYRDWFYRRDINFNANKKLIDLTKAGTFDFLIIGCDDNSSYSQTHLERRHLEEYGRNFGLGKTVLQITSGADELGMMMISRAINKDLNEIPFVATEYNDGRGRKTKSTYVNEEIGSAIDDAIVAVGGLKVPSPEKADLVLAVNTPRNGKTLAANSAENTVAPRKETKTFLKLLKNLTEKNYPVAVADITFGNGSDNAMMNQLRREDLQFKIRAYGGWNTATNTTGFLIGAGVLTKFMDEDSVNSLLITRYLDDWAYQSNVRQTVGYALYNFPGEGSYSELNEKKEAVELKTAENLYNFANENFTVHPENITVNFPWNRMFECDISFKINVTGGL